MAEDKDLLWEILWAIKWVWEQVSQLSERVTKLEESPKSQWEDPELESEVSWRLVDKVVYIVTQDITADYWVQQLDQYSMRAKKILPNEQHFFETHEEAQNYVDTKVPENKKRDCFISTKTVTYEQ